jgi:hypothetical protein
MILKYIAPNFMLLVINLNSILALSLIYSDRGEPVEPYSC